MSRKTKVPSFYKQTRQFLHRCFIPLTCIVLLYKAITYLLFYPLLRILWAIGLHFAPVSYITSNNISDLYRSPSILLVLLFIGIAMGFWSLYGLSIMIQCLDFCNREIHFTYSQIFKTSVSSIRHVLKPRNWLMLLFCAFVIPFSNVVIASNFISSITIPEYIMETINDSRLFSSLFTAFSLLLLIVVVKLMYSVHYFVLEKRDFKDAIHESCALQKSHTIKDFVQLILWKTLVLTKYTFVFFLFSLILFAFIWLLSKSSPKALLAGYVSETYIANPLINYLLDSIMEISQIAFISFLYYHYRSRKECAESEESEAFQISSDNRTIYGNRRPFFLLVTGAVAVFFFVIAVFSYAPIGQEILTTYFEPDTQLTAHRGYSAVAPENTLPAFQAAIDSGIVDYAELDVQMTSDGVVVLTHDTNLSRCTGRNANVYDLTYDEVRTLDAGSFFSSEFEGTKIPTLDEVIKLCKGKIKLNIEIKSNSHTPDLEAETVRIIKENNFENDCVITSLSYESLCKVKEFNPELKTGLILAMGVGNYYDLENVDFFSIESTFVTSKVVSQLHMRNKEIHVWTVDTEENAEKMMDRGVDNIITGNPPLVHSVLTQDQNNILSLFQLFFDTEQLQQFLTEASVTY